MKSVFVCSRIGVFFAWLEVLVTVARKRTEEGDKSCSRALLDGANCGDRSKPAGQNSLDAGPKIGSIPLNTYLYACWDNKQFRLDTLDAS